MALIRSLCDCRLLPFSTRRRLATSTLLVVLLLIAVTAGERFGRAGDNAAKPDQQHDVPASPLSPEDALGIFELAPGLRLQLVAAEPDIIDPVAAVFDEAGRLWVVEMRDYPNGPTPGAKPQSRIVILQDDDNDGRYTRTSVFAENLLFATGVQPWKDGVIVTMAGEVAFLKDTDGDGKADHRETWFTGFAEQNPQLRANHPTFGLDNQIYISNGLRGGDVISRRDENSKPLSISGMDFRFDPLSGEYEAVTGVGQFGLTFDDFGNRFVCSNRNPCKHIVLADRYLKRNPHLGVSTATHDVSPAGPDSRVYAISRTWTTSTLHAGQFTAACGVTIYRGDQLPEAFRGNSFTCEPTGNLVHRDVIRPDGATFTSSYGRKEVEFLASRDEWFRPVNLTNGPDGALYVVDMYRAVIEHPQFMPAELKERPDLTLGNDRGRIWRIVNADASSAKPHTKRQWPADASTAELVTMLSDENAWHRETAARLLFQRQDNAAAEALRKLAGNESAPAASRVHALWTLQGLKQLTTADLATALTDRHPRVREQAIRLSEPHLSEDSPLRKKLTAMTGDSDARVRFQLALSLGETAADASRLQALAGILMSGPDHWTRVAVASSVGDDAFKVLQIVLQQVAAGDATVAAGIPETVELLAELVGSRGDAEEIRAALGAILQSGGDTTDDASRLPLQMAGIRGLARRSRLLTKLADSLPEADAARMEQFSSRLIDRARNRSLSSDQRDEAISLLPNIDSAQAGKVLIELSQSDPSRDVQIAAISTLGRFSDPQIAEILLDGFATRTPAYRSAVLDAMLSNTTRTKTLLEQIADGDIAVAELGPARVNRLTRHRDADIRKQAAKLLADAIPADRQKVLAEYQAALALSADPVRGREVFRKTCITCHRIGDLGVNVAPDIADSRTKQPAQLLTAILDPNRAVDNNYFGYTVLLVSGRSETGIITAETASSITLKQPENKTITILRRDIEELRASGLSLMPVGLEKNISVQQMADLISFIKNWRYLDGRVPIDVGP